jgi:hypothetical protein
MVTARSVAPSYAPAASELGALVTLSTVVPGEPPGMCAGCNVSAVTPLPTSDTPLIAQTPCSSTLP